MPRDAIVIRFRPTDPERVLASAEKAQRRTGRYGVSVFADVPREGEDPEATVQRLLDQAQLVGMHPEKHKKFYVCSQAGELLDEEFLFYKDEDDDELEEHFSVDLGPAPTAAGEVGRFLALFDEERKWTT